MPIDDENAARAMILASENREAMLDGEIDALTCAVKIIKYVLPAWAGAGIDVAEHLLTRYMTYKRAVLAESFQQEIDPALVAKHARESEAFRRFVEQDLPGLAFDACKKAENTRSDDRIRRIGRILANSLHVDPPPQADDIEELMRIATALEDKDVLVLKELCRRRENCWNDSQGRAEPSETENAETFDADLIGITGSQGNLESVIAKLQSLGLLDPQLAYEVVPGYVLLDKARRFASFALAQHDTPSAGT